MYVYVIDTISFTHRPTILNEFDTFSNRRRCGVIKAFYTLVLF